MIPAALLFSAAPPAGSPTDAPAGRAAEVVAALCAASRAEALPPDERDVESRVAAVEAIGRLAVELCAGDESSGDAPGDAMGGAAGYVRGLLREEAAPALLGALRDYTTDNRGDVGSWARGAAMESLVTVLPLALGGGGAAAGGGDAAALAAAAAGGMLRVGVERIARLREAAAAHARALLAAPAVRAGAPRAPAPLRGPRLVPTRSRRVALALRVTCGQTPPHHLCPASATSPRLLRCP